MALISEKPPPIEKISDALQSIPTMKEELHRAFEVLQFHYPSTLSSFQWSDIDSYISSTQTSLETQLKKLKSNHPPPQYQLVAQPDQPHREQQQQYQPLEKQKNQVTLSLTISMHENGCNGLHNFILSSDKTPLDRMEVMEAVSCALDPAKLVLDSLQGIFPISIMKTKVRSTTIACMYILQGVSAVGQEIKPEIKEEAKKLAVEWKENVLPQLYIQLFITYGLKDQRSMDEWLEMIVSIANKTCSVDMCRGLGLDSKVTEIVKRLISKTEHVDAIKFVYAFELVDTFPPVPLLEAYLKESKKAAQKILDKGNKSYASVHEAIAIEISSLRWVINCIDTHKLGSHFLRESLVKRIAELKKEKPSKRCR